MSILHGFPVEKQIQKNEIKTKELILIQYSYEVNGYYSRILRIIVLQLFVFVLTDAAITVNMNVLMKDSQRHLLKRPEQFKPLPVPSADELKRFLPEIDELSNQVEQNNIAAVNQGYLLLHYLNQVLLLNLGNISLIAYGTLRV